MRQANGSIPAPLVKVMNLWEKIVDSYRQERDRTEKDSWERYSWDACIQTAESILAGLKEAWCG